MRIATGFLYFLVFLTSIKLKAQVNEDKVGGWYLYVWNTTVGDGPWGFQGDIQYRNWNIVGDLQQLLLRGGPTFSVNPNLKFTLGYTYVLSSAYGDSKSTIAENMIYQEALISHKLLTRFYFTHRFRNEQRWVEGLDFRTRFRYFIAINVPLNQLDLKKGAYYISYNNEIFINGQKDIGSGKEVKILDRYRIYLAFGYSIRDNLKVQAGYMYQAAEIIQKSQIQINLHHSF